MCDLSLFSKESGSVEPEEMGEEDSGFEDEAFFLCVWDVRFSIEQMSVEFSVRGPR